MMLSAILCHHASSEKFIFVGSCIVATFKLKETTVSSCDMLIAGRSGKARFDATKD